MFASKILAVSFSLGVALHAQSPELRTLIAASPHLPVEQIPLTIAAVGTVSSVALDGRGTIYVLQRGDKVDPVIAVNQEGRVLRSWGKGMFTVPHSIRIDPEGNVWTVDAGSSVLLKFSPEGKKLQEIVVGETATGSGCAFPTLCGTTDVTFSSGGRLFISDGYGNARILEYTSTGKRVKAWGSAGSGPAQFQIPHGIAVVGNVLYVADRGNARVQLFDLDGHYLREWTHLGRPFALKLAGGALWVSLMTLEPGRQASPWLVKVDPVDGKILGQAELPGPHSIDVTEAGEFAASGCCGGTNPSGFSWFRR
jgi:DNA-binding beta-propeller fold protein YncE